MKVNSIKETIAKSGKDNMEKDLFLLNSAIESAQTDITLRFYTWAPMCVSLGRNQKELLFGIKNIDVVNRPTGGRALLHNNELTYSVVMPTKDNLSIMKSYREISDAIIAGFNKLGIKLDYAGEKGKKLQYCMNISSGADICFNGKKLIGSAQFRKKGYLLQHGSILMDADFELIEKIFKEDVEKESIITLKEINPNITMKDLIEAIEYGFKEKFEH